MLADENTVCVRQEMPFKQAVRVMHLTAGGVVVCCCACCVVSLLPCRPVVVNIGRAGMATDNVTQRVIMIKENEKPHRWAGAGEAGGQRLATVGLDHRQPCYYGI